MNEIQPAADVMPHGARVVVEIGGRPVVRRTEGGSYRLHGVRVVRLEGERDPVPLHRIERQICHRPRP